MKTYLIQRGKFKNGDYKKGLDSIVELDYMGAAEFEFGALPRSLANIRNRINDYTYTNFRIDINHNDKVITVFHPVRITEEETLLYLIELAYNRMVLHERSDFNTYLYPSKHDIEWQNKRGHQTDFWWDIDNDIMFWKEDDRFNAKFRSVISTKS